MKNIETQANEKLPTYASPMDSERLWSNIENQLKEDKKRRFLLWFWPLLLGLSLIGGFYYAFFNAQKEEISNVVSEPTAGIEKIQEFTTSSKPTINTEEVLVVEGEERTQNQGNQADYGSFRSTNPPNLLKGEHISSNLSNTTSNNSNVVLEMNETSSNDLESTLALGDWVSQAQDDVSSISINSPKKPINPTNQSNILEKSASNLENQTEVSTVKLKSKQVYEFSLLRSPISLVFSQIETKLQIASINLKNQCYSFKKKRGAPYIGIYGGAQYPLKKLSTENTEFYSLLEKRKASETVLEGKSIGAFMGFRIKGGLFLVGGAEYNCINERFDWEKTMRDTIGRTVVQSYLLNAPGDTTFFADTAFVVQNTIDSKKTFNHYRFLQIPIAFGYEFKNAGKWKPFIKGGVAFNIRFRQKAEIYNLAGEPTLYLSSASSTADYPFATKINISPFVNLGTAYLLTSRVELFGEARYFHHTQRVTSGLYPLVQRYRLPGVNMGLKFRM
jgi:hypothetical protein